jgi:hypothetical protein
MRALDILAVVSGAAGIASFALTLVDRFSEWRRYLVPVSSFLVGYALSAASLLMFPSIAMGVSHEHSWPVIIIILALVAALVFLCMQFFKHGYAPFAWMTLYFGMLLGIPKLVETYTLSSGEVPFTDLLVLANSKEQAGDIAGAIHYSDLAERAASDSVMKAEIHKKLLGLQSSLVNAKKP